MTASQELRTGVRCVVTHPSKNGEFQKGDVIWLEEDGAIMNGTIKAWMAAEDVQEATEGMEVKSATPIAAELREWATCSGVFLLYSDLSDAAFNTIEEWEGSDDWLHYSPEDHRTYALLVACALEDDDADQA